VAKFENSIKITISRKAMEVKKSFQAIKRRAKKSGPQRMLRLNEMLLQSRWEYSQLNSNSAGILSDAGISPTIQGSSEYSTISSLFTEIRLISCRVIIAPNFNPASAITATVAIIGTHLVSNATTHPSPPLAATDVQNLDRKVRMSVGGYATRSLRYKMKVPPGLEFSNIAADAPATPTPWAGSPGCVRIYADHCTVSVPYVVIWIETMHHVRGRQ